MSSCITVIAGFTTPTTPQDLKVFIRKFLKRKSEQFPLITFVYMEVSDSDRNTLNILRGNLSDYPRIYHIRGGNNIMVAVDSANEETITESFKQVEKLYIDEMKAFRQHMKNKTKNNNNPHINNDDEKIESCDDNDKLISDDSDDVNNKPVVQPSKKQVNSKQVQVKNITTKNIPNNNPKTQKNVPRMNNDEEEEYHLVSNDQAPTNQNQSDPVSENQNQSDPVLENQNQSDPILEKKKNLEKLVLLNKKCNEMKLGMVKEIARRKKIEGTIDKKNEAEKKNDDGKEYRKSLRKTIKN